MYPGSLVVTVRLFLYIPEPRFKDKRYQLSLSPDDNVPTEHARQVGAENNSLQVQFSGWYLVYSTVYFRPRTNRSCGNLRHQVCVL